MSLDLPKDYKLVYQGGHHNVYCNGETHKSTVGGGFTNAYPETRVKYEYKCNCEKFQKPSVLTD